MIIIGAGLSGFLPAVQFEIITDWREPDVIRVAPVSLSNSFADTFRFAKILKNCLK
ncbi:MAG: hypothetical protein H0U50_06230 [Pyrinomonadaceae bacterium]|nr:hypothetical protein [Pyrinomonadaceae bacterium]